jgi:hypothetical protein
MSVRTVHLQLSAAPPAAAINVWPVTVSRSIFLGDLTQVHVNWGGRDLVIRQTEADTFKDGATAYLSIDPGHCVLLEPGAAAEAEIAAPPPPQPVMAKMTAVMTMTTNLPGNISFSVRIVCSCPTECACWPRKPRRLDETRLNYTAAPCTGLQFIFNSCSTGKRL